MRLDEALAHCPVVAILRGVRPEEVVDHAKALYDAGIRAVEVPLNSPDPLASIAQLVAASGSAMACGAGTVLTVAEVEAVQGAGATFVVSPNTDPAVIARAVALWMDAAPGFATATEAFAALTAGARHLKLFPASTYSPSHLRQLRAVLPPLIPVLAVGGVTPETFADWRAAGAGGFGLGSELYKPGQSPAETRAKADRVVEALGG